MRYWARDGAGPGRAGPRHAHRYSQTRLIFSGQFTAQFARLGRIVGRRRDALTRFQAVRQTNRSGTLLHREEDTRQLHSRPWLGSWSRTVTTHSHVANEFLVADCLIGFVHRRRTLRAGAVAGAGISTSVVVSARITSFQHASVCATRTLQQRMHRTMSECHTTRHRWRMQSADDDGARRRNLHRRCARFINS